jgi:hypothetical protein
MKNIRTPRTLAECEFTTDYPRMPRGRPPIARSSWVILVMALATAAAVAMGWI